MTLYAQNQENSLSQINVKTKLLIQKQASFPVSDPSVGKFVLSELYCNIKKLGLKTTRASGRKGTHNTMATTF